MIQFDDHIFPMGWQKTTNKHQTLGVKNWWTKMV